MAQDRPTASELLAAIADFLREEATPALDKAEPRLGFQMRVAANALAIAKHAEPLTVHKVASGTELAMEMIEEGQWY